MDFYFIFNLIYSLDSLRLNSNFCWVFFKNKTCKQDIYIYVYTSKQIKYKDYNSLKGKTNKVKFKFRRTNYKGTRVV